MTQLELFMPKRRHKVSAGMAAARMIAILAIRHKWTTRADFSDHGLTDRECRAGRRASHGRIIYGQRGFILLQDATPDEIMACLNTTVSMIQELQEEHKWTARRAHGVLNGTMVAK